MRIHSQSIFPNTLYNMQNKTTATAEQKRETLERIINHEVYTMANSTGQMYYDFALGCIDVENQNMPELFNEYDEETEEHAEILQYFIVSDYLADKLIENGLCVMKTDDLCFYCRTQCGISILDSREFDFLVNND